MTRFLCLGVLACLLPLGCKKKSHDDFIPPAPPPPAFNVTRSFNDEVVAIAAAADASGDIYLGGSFECFGSTKAGHIIRLNANGTVDAAFDTGLGFDSDVHAILALGNGDIIVGGAFSDYDGNSTNCIIRLNPDGTVDTLDQGTGFDSSVEAIVAAPDGSSDFVITGDFVNYNANSSERIARLNSDLTLDAAAAGTGFDGSVRALAATNDASGDVIVGGFFLNYDTTGSEHIVRLNGDLTPDTAAVTTGFDQAVVALAIASDGTIFAGGDFTDYAGNNSERIARLNGNLTFNAAVTGTGFDGTVRGLVVVPATLNDVVAVGDFGDFNGGPSVGIARLNATLTLDTGAPGPGFFADIGSARTVALAADGSNDLLVGGDFVTYNQTGVHRYVRLDTNLAIDAKTPEGAGFDGVALAILPASNGGVYATGFFSVYNGNYNYGILRLNPDGTVDNAFDANIGFDDAAAALAAANDGSGDIFAGGAFTEFDTNASFGIVRINSDGSFDTAAVGTGFNGDVFSIMPALDGSGDIFVAGAFTTYNGASSEHIIRLNGDLTTDTAAVGAGFDGDVISLLVLSGGDVVVVGGFQNYATQASNSLIRLNSDLSVDTAASGIGFDDYAEHVILAPDGSGDFIVAGDFTDYDGDATLGIVRLNSDFTIDTPGVGSGFDSYVSRLAAYGSQVYAVGDFLDYDGTTVGHVARLNGDLTLDSAFDTGYGADNTLFSVVVVGSDIYVVGDFSHVNFTTVGKIARLGPGGALD